MTERQPICDEIAADAAGLMSLPAQAPERARAEEHARGCADCTRALAEGRELLSLIEAKPLPAPSGAALARASAAVLAEAEREEQTRGALAVFAAVVACWAIPLALMRKPLVPLTGNDSFGLSFSLMLLAIVASVATVAWSRRAAVLFPVLSAIAALVAGRGGALAPVVGAHCAAIEVMTAVGAGAAAWLLARGLSRARGDRTLMPSPRPATRQLAAVGGGALAGHAALALGCSAAAELPHGLVFHTGPVVLAIALAFVIARRPAAVKVRAVKSEI
jgi:hypothetical protein